MTDTSRYRTIRKWTWARTWHDRNPKAQQGFCTVANVEEPHRAQWSVKVRETTGGVAWVAACDEHLLPEEEN
jgi:hypothetical protein